MPANILQKRRMKLSRLIIYDIQNETPKAENGDILFFANPIVKPCMGCFGCWTKTPGRCVINDRCRDIPSYIAKCDELILISPILFGGYSENIKAVIDRFIPYVLPYFRIVDGKMHHKMRYKHSFDLTVLFYGKCDSEEKQIAESLVNANAVNFGAKNCKVKFFDNVEELKGELI